MKTSLILALTLSLLSLDRTFAQEYFLENFDDTDTAGLLARGWSIGHRSGNPVFDPANYEDNADFWVAPPTAPKLADPSLSNDPSGTDTAFLLPPNANGLESGGRYLLSDSDSAGGSNDVGSQVEFFAITPSFSTLGSTQAWFHADAEIENNNNGECIVSLDASIDGGATWVPMWQTSEPQRPRNSYARALIDETEFSGFEELGGAYPVLGSGSRVKTWSGVNGRWHVVLPAEANNQTNVRLRIRYYEPADAWWIALDNLLVNNSPPPTGSQVILSETFDAGIPATWITTPSTHPWGAQPLKDQNSDFYRRDKFDAAVNVDIFREHQARTAAGLLTLPLEALLRLSYEDYSTQPDLANFDPNAFLDGLGLLMLAGQNYAIWSEGPNVPDQVSVLSTPVLDLSATSAVFLDFDSEVLIGDSSEKFDVFVSVDGGATFSQIFTYTGALMDFAEASYFTHHYIEVPQAAGENDAVFSFQARGGESEQPPSGASAYQGFWAIDNVRVTATPGAVPPVPLVIALEDGNVRISWEGTGRLESAERVAGPWVLVPGATSPVIVTPGAGAYYRLLK